MGVTKIFWLDRGYNCYELQGLAHGVRASLSWNSGGYKITVMGEELAERPQSLDEAKMLGLKTLRAWIHELNRAMEELMPKGGE